MNSAERGPITTWGSVASSALDQSVCRAASVMVECVRRTDSKCGVNSATSCEVRAISGTRMITERPSAIVRLASSIYMAVFPDPVTPWSRLVPSGCAHIELSAAVCSAVCVIDSVARVGSGEAEDLPLRRFFVRPLGSIVRHTCTGWVA